MTDSEKIEFDWITTQLARLAPATTVSATATLARAQVAMLTTHSAAKFPTLVSDFLAAKTKAGQDTSALMAKVGATLWAELHKRAGFGVADKPAESRWLLSFAARLPCGACKSFFAEYLKTTPPDFNAYFAWTVGLHNAVNAKLGKPQVTLAEAQTIWAKQQ